MSLSSLSSSKLCGHGTGVEQTRVRQLFRNQSGCIKFCCLRLLWRSLVKIRIGIGYEQGIGIECNWEEEPELDVPGRGLA